MIILRRMYFSTIHLLPLSFSFLEFILKSFHADILSKENSIGNNSRRLSQTSNYKVNSTDYHNIRQHSICKFQSKYDINPLSQS